MKKRRTFDIDLPEEAEEVGQGGTFPAGKVGETEGPALRRSPMAAAISENAEALRDRRALEQQIREENDALAAEHVRLKKLGLIVDRIPLEAIQTRKLIRDRHHGDDQELAELVTSIREIGLSNPIRVEARDDGSYELIQGFRRLSAWRQILAETGDTEAWGTIPAGILPRGEGLEGLYRRMVDENLVRKDISFAEMAMLALNYARDPGIEENDPDKAVAALFQSAGYQKRSYIRQFIRLMYRLEDDLRFPQHVPRALGLQLAARLEEEPALVARIKAALKGWENRSVLDEAQVLRAALDAPKAPAEPGRAALPAAGQGAAVEGRARTSFQVASGGARAKCTAANGRLEIRLDRDFTTMDRRRLEAAVARLLSDLG